MWDVVFTKQAVKDAKNLKAAGLDAKAKHLIEVVRKDPFGQPPSYKALVGNLAGLYSRRLVYEVAREAHVKEGIEYIGTVKIVRMWSHYNDAQPMK
ncbi:type II toxin-antitoxin system YoeB family toxin [Collinsella tanakaei]|uniref:type II toxin-antitoxin system YoeB family toxin n=1 Tax=Collinsella tanakaei TaxID=626935 RepID=UPI00248E3438|nr:Txe/YoeB family addiction module toxin [Collinsella tanakaei]